MFIAGAASGWVASRALPSRSAAVGVAINATAAYRTFVVEVAHPVEVDAAHEQHLMRWLSKRLGRKLTAPDLSKFGYSLIGGRLLPAGGYAAAQLMYENANKARLTALCTGGAGNRDGVPLPAGRGREHLRLDRSRVRVRCHGTCHPRRTAADRRSDLSRFRQELRTAPRISTDPEPHLRRHDNRFESTRVRQTHRRGNDEETDTVCTAVCCDGDGNRSSGMAQAQGNETRVRVPVRSKSSMGTDSASTRPAVRRQMVSLTPNTYDIGVEKRGLGESSRGTSSPRAGYVAPMEKSMPSKSVFSGNAARDRRGTAALGREATGRNDECERWHRYRRRARAASSRSPTKAANPNSSWRPMSRCSRMFRPIKRC